MAAINRLVSTIENHGVPRLDPILPTIEGINRSLLMASGNLAEAIIPALAVERNANTAASARTMYPGLPANVFAASDRGVMEVASTFPSRVPTHTVTEVK